MTHALKTWPEYYKAVSDGIKPFEIRKNDRDFRVGEILLLQEWNPETKEYTRNEFEVIITYILQGGQFGIEKDFVVMGVKEKEY